jgi:nucleotide-binding universal stress UspA family protein
LLDGQVRKIEEDGAHITKAHLRSGEPDAEVVGLAEDIGADMIVVGSRGTSPLRRPIGSVSSSIATHAHCPVLIARGG